MSAIPHVERLPLPKVSGRRAGVRVFPRRRGLSLAGITRLALKIFISTAVLHLILGFAGQLVIESARQEAIRAGERATIVGRSAERLQRQVEEIESASAVSRWAELNGFYSEYELGDATAAK